MKYIVVYFLIEFIKVTCPGTNDPTIKQCVIKDTTTQRIEFNTKAEAESYRISGAMLYHKSNRSPFNGFEVTNFKLDSIKVQ
jgi:hypothetical protein